jgi:hypothetical protein
VVCFHFFLLLTFQDWNNICFVYLTVPEDISTQMIVNYQFSGPIFDKSYVEYNTTVNTTARVDATCNRMWQISDEARYQCWADLTSLTPSSSYFFTCTLAFGNNTVSSKSRKFRTGPSVNSNEEVKYISGGDLAWTDAGKALATFAGTQDPLFAIIGGDVSYDNGDRNCYRLWDLWFSYWEDMMHTTDNYTIPILTCPGNHESGGFRTPRSWDHSYIKYFPHKTGLQSVDIQNRDLFHYHRISGHTIIIGLDTWVHTEPKDQVQFINDTLTQYESLRNKIAFYHNAIYPSIQYTPKSDNYLVVNAIVKEWKPLFDFHSLNLAFENHFHLYKRTYTLYQDEIMDDGNGTIYLGDGHWGIFNDEDSPADYSTVPQIRDIINMPHVHVVTSRANGTNVWSMGYNWDTKQLSRVVPDDVNV